MSPRVQPESTTESFYFSCFQFGLLRLQESWATVRGGRLAGKSPPAAKCSAGWEVRAIRLRNSSTRPRRGKRGPQGTELKEARGCDPEVPLLPPPKPALQDSTWVCPRKEEQPCLQR